ncbi:MAG: hypothetical protein M3440_11145 [Chloroflexota bacterium]|nr:hypothetical protein [Chloroflexota bacterium]
MDDTANAQVLGLAGITSGIVGGVVAAIMHRRAIRKEKAAAAINSGNVAALVESVKGSTNESLSRALSQAPQSRDEWVAAAQRVKAQAAATAKEGQKRSKKRLAEVDVEAVSKRARNAVPTSELLDQAEKLRKRARNATKESRKRSKKRLENIDLEGLSKKGRDSAAVLSSDLATGAAALAAAATQQSRGVAGSVKQQSYQVKNRAGHVVNDARSLGEQLVEQAKDRAPDLRHAVDKSVAPRVKDLRQSAAPLLGSAANALTSTLESGKELVSETKHNADRELLPALKVKAGTAAKSIEHVTSQASDTWSGVSGTVDERSRNAAHAAAQGTRDTGALAAWSIAAGGLIFYGFLDAEQKEKVKAAGSRIVHEAREIYRDIQG